MNKCSIECADRYLKYENVNYSWFFTFLKKAFKLWDDVGAKYALENEDELKDQMNFAKMVDLPPGECMIKHFLVVILSIPSSVSFFVLILLL